MMEGRFKNEEHILRLVGIFAVGLLLFFALKALLVPESFGYYGHYRAGALPDNRARPVVFAGRAACGACHDEQAKALAGGMHRGVGCEACHGAQAAHANADDPAAQKPVRPTTQVCLVCHTANVAKPAGFPQIKLKEHAEAGACFECHKPHAPSV